MKVIFARHGESTANTLHVFSNQQADHPLTEKGRGQAQALANRLSATEFAGILLQSDSPGSGNCPDHQ